MLPFATSMMAAGGAGTYTANAVDFDGSADYLSKAADFTGDADSPFGILSVWLRLDGGNAANMEVIRNAGALVEVQRFTDNKFYVTVAPSVGAGFGFKTVATYTSGATWLHLLASWDTNHGAGTKVGQLYINDVSDYALGADAGAGFNVNYTAGAWAVAANTSGTSKFNGCLAECYLAPGQYLDFSSSANRRKFISAAGKPVDLGSTGATPTGVAPLLYLPNVAASVNVNAGTGGNFVINGAPAVASSSPSTLGAPYVDGDEAG